MLFMVLFRQIYINIFKRFCKKKLYIAFLNINMEKEGEQIIGLF